MTTARVPLARVKLTPEERKAQREAAGEARRLQNQRAAFGSTACPACGKKVTPTKAGKLRKHGPKGAPCPGPTDTAAPVTIGQSVAGTAGAALGEAAAPAPQPYALLPRALRDLYATDRERPRSQQVGPGVSSLGGCRRRYAEEVLGTTKTNAGDLLAACLGTAIHDALERATLAQGGPFVRKGHEVDVPVVIPGLELPGKADAFLDGWVEDWKTVGTVSPGHAPTRQQKWQVQSYAYGLSAAGRTVTGVRLVFIPRHGRGDDAVVWEDTYRPEVAEEAVSWAAQIESDLLIGIKPEPERVASSYCRDWCPFFDPTGVGSGCTGLPDKPVDEVLDEPEVIEAASAYLAAAAIARAAKATQDAAKAVLVGRAGRAGDAVVTWSDPKPREVLDEAAVRAQYEADGVPLPTRTDVASPRISVKAAPKEEQA